VIKDDLGWTLAERIVRAKGEDGEEEEEMVGTPGEVNQALMELGATYCSPAGSGIDDGDPLKEFYISTKLGAAIGGAMRDGSSNIRGRVENLIAEQSLASNNGKRCCRMCDGNGIATAYYDIMDRINEDLHKTKNTDIKRIYAIAGHASLPIPPPKKAKREEVIAVAVISVQPSNSERCWLMVKRPSTGLLASQWEFPSVCVWNSADEKKKKKTTKTEGKQSTGAVEVPLIQPAVRSDALDSFLSDIFQSNKSQMQSSINWNKRVQVKDAPIVHVFSHVCHTMWVEHSDFKVAGINGGSDISKRWKLENGREVGWMTEEDMKSAGITSGVRKVLAKASTIATKKSR